MPKIEINNLTYIYNNRKGGEITAINDLSCVFESGKFNVIIGSSGCGKTTLLRVVAGLNDEFEGSVLENGKNILDYTVEERNISYVTQNYALYPHMTVFDNIAFPLKIKRANKEEIIDRVYKIAKELDLMVCLSRKPKYLSGGQKQRIALARSLIKGSELYLFDEPLSNIDPQVRAEQRIFIKRIIEKYNATAIYVTHDFQEALALADNLFVMDEGKIVISGNPQDVYKSGNPIVNAFIRATFENKYEK